MVNFRLIGIRLGEGLKYSTSINEINRIATAIFDFEASSHPHESITSSRSQLIYDWVMTLGEQPIEEKKKLELLQDFINTLTPEDSSLRNLIKETAKVPQLDFWSIIHKDIIRVAKNKFEDEYYADAVESAFKEINKRVKEIVKNKTGEELDGASLMYKALSERNPIVVLDDLSSETGRNIQKGYMQIFAGAITGIRNPKAHENIVIDRERAIHFIFLASLLMCKLDEAKF
ncbi:MAG: TIGR02391 family protein [Bacteroidales bacterium]